jgi:NAD(P)-dependent dehydrogenase (short-subunit alcohol dehydrogenase family)
MSFTQFTPGIALITGASSGIGRAAAISLAARGWTCILSGRREAQLDETAKLALEARGSLDPSGGSKTTLPRCVPGDLSKVEDIVALFGVIKESYGERAIYH